MSVNVCYFTVHGYQRSPNTRTGRQMILYCNQFQLMVSPREFILSIYTKDMVNNSPSKVINAQNWKYRYSPLALPSSLLCSLFFSAPSRDIMITCDMKTQMKHLFHCDSSSPQVISLQIGITKKFLKSELLAQLCLCNWLETFDGKEYKFTPEGLQLVKKG